MRAFVSFTLVTVLCVSGQPSAYSAEPDALLRHIEAEWEGKVVRDQAVPERPVIGIVFHCTSRVSDEVIEQLVAFPQLRTLGLIGGQRLTDKGLEHIGKLTNLETLEIRNRTLTADGLKHLTKLPNLKSLLLWGVTLNKQSGETLEGLKALEVLELRSVTVSTEALSSIKKLKNLKQIDGHDCDGAFTSEDDVRKEFPNVKVTLLK